MTDVAARGPGVALLAEGPAIRQMFGFKVRLAIDDLDRTLSLLLGNLADLRQFVERSHSQVGGAPLPGGRAADRDDLFLSNCERLIYNAVCAVMSRVDHHRRIFGDGCDDVFLPLKPEYQLRAREVFDCSGLARFVQALQQHVVHRGLPTLRATGNSSRDFTLRLDRDDLLEWDRWPARARTWLRRQPESVDIVGVLTAYENAAIQFDGWLRQTVIQEYEGKLERLGVAERQLNMIFFAGEL